MNRKQMIAALVEDWAVSAAGDRDFIRNIARQGCKGFENMTVKELRKACADAGIEDRCEHGMFYSGAGACPQCGGGAE